MMIDSSVLWSVACGLLLVYAIVFTFLYLDTSHERRWYRDLFDEYYKKWSEADAELHMLKWEKK